MKSTQQASFEDLWCVAGLNNVVNVTADEFSVDDLLDLSDKDFSTSGEESFEEDFASVSSQDNDSNSLNSSKFLTSGDIVSLPADQLPVPVYTHNFIKFNLLHGKLSATFTKFDKNGEIN